MGESRVDGRRRGSVVVGFLVVAVIIGFAIHPAGADVTAVKGSGMDYIANVSLFGGPSNQRGPAGTTGCDGGSSVACNITVDLPAAGGSDDATSPGAIAQYGPAIIFSFDGGSTLHTEGTLGASGSATTTATVSGIDASDSEVFTADSASSTCSSSQSGGNTASTTITNGTVQTSEGDPNVDGDEVNTPVPTNPTPGFSIHGVIEGVGDNFDYFFNEQTTNGDGSITVYAAHLRLNGPIAVGDVYIGKSECGITATGPTVPPTSGASTSSSPSSTMGPTTTGGSNTTTTGGGSNTTTTGGSGGGGVNEVSGGAYGYFTSVSLFQGPANTRGPAPVVELPPGGSATPITKSDPTASAVYGPAEIFSSGQLDVSTEGTTGANGSVKSSARVQNVNRGGTEVFTAADIKGDCTANASGETGTTKLTGGKLTISQGNPDIDGDETVIDLPSDPTPGVSFNGDLESVGDHFQLVLNEQNKTAGAITVNAAHLKLLGPTAVGDLFVGQVRCATTATGGSGSGTGGSGSGTGSTSGSTARTGAAVLKWLELALSLLAVGVAIHWAGKRRLTGDSPRLIP